jgi:hypothetical protein
MSRLASTSARCGHLDEHRAVARVADEPPGSVAVIGDETVRLIPTPWRTRRIHARFMILCPLPVPRRRASNRKQWPDRGSMDIAQHHSQERGTGPAERSNRDKGGSASGLAPRQAYSGIRGAVDFVICDELRGPYPSRPPRYHLHTVVDHPFALLSSTPSLDTLSRTLPEGRIRRLRPDAITSIFATSARSLNPSPRDPNTGPALLGSIHTQISAGAPTVGSCR